MQVYGPPNRRLLLPLGVLYDAICDTTRPSHDCSSDFALRSSWDALYLRIMSHKYCVGSAAKCMYFCAAPVDNDGRSKAEVAHAEVALCRGVDGGSFDGVVHMLQPCE
jgi:hypothetical protein